jgi:hypothetical protein
MVASVGYLARIPESDRAELQEIRLALKRLSDRSGLDDTEILFLSRKVGSSVPVSIFSGERSPLEALVAYMHLEQGLGFAEIGRTIGRDARVIWRTFSIGKMKQGGGTIGMPLPIDVFKRRSLSILEALVSYLHDKEGLRLAEISRILRKSYSTVSTAYRRGSAKVPR